MEDWKEEIGTPQFTDSKGFSEDADLLSDHVDSTDLGKIRQEIAEDEVYSDLVKAFEEEKRGMISRYESKIAQATKETELFLQKYWDKKIQELERKYQQVCSERNPLGVESELKVISELEYWKQEHTPAIIEDIKKKTDQKAHDFLYNKRKELTQQMNREVQELVYLIQKENEQELRKKKNSLKKENAWLEDQFTRNLKNECFRELMLQKDFKLKQALADRLGEEYEKQVRKEIYPAIWQEIQRSKTGLIREEALKEAEEAYEFNRSKIEENYIGKIKAIEEKYESTIQREIESKVKERLNRKNKDMHIGYMRKHDKQAQTIQDHFYKNYKVKFQELRSNIAKEKTEVARLKSLLNVKMKQHAQKRHEEMKIIQQQEGLIEKKLRNLEYEAYYQEQYACNEDHSVVHKPISLPKEELSTIEEPVFPVRKEPSPRKLLGPYSSKEIVANLLLQNLESAKTQAWTYLNDSERPPEKENRVAFLKPQTQSPEKKSLYHQLLQDRFGVIEPRK